MLTDHQLTLLDQLYQNSKVGSTECKLYADQRIFALFFGANAGPYTLKMQTRFDNMLDEMLRYKECFEKTPPPERRIFAHFLMDKIYKHSPDNRNLMEGVTCKRGCYTCCRMRVQLPISEALDIYKTALERNVPINWNRAKKQKGKRQEEYSTHLMGKYNKCDFLRDGDCMIYDIRPCVCRMYLVTTPPEMCEMDLSKNPPKTLNVESLVANLLYNGYCNAKDERISSLANFLTEFQNKEVERMWNVYFR